MQYLVDYGSGLLVPNVCEQEEWWRSIRNSADKVAFASFRPPHCVVFVPQWSHHLRPMLEVRQMVSIRAVGHRPQRTPIVHRADQADLYIEYIHEIGVDGCDVEILDLAVAVLLGIVPAERRSLVSCERTHAGFQVFSLHTQYSKDVIKP